MKFIALATIVFLAELSVPEALILHAASVTDCTSVEASCTWGIAAKISESIIKNVYVSFVYVATPTTITTTKNSFAAHPNIKGLAIYSVGSDSIDTIDLMTKEIMGAYPLLAGIIYTSVAAKKADLLKAYTYITGLASPILIFVEGATIPGDATLPLAIWVTDTTKALLTAVGGQAFQPNCELRFVGPSTDFTSTVTDLITVEDCKYINVYASVFGTHELAYEQIVATYLKTAISCNAACSTCIGATASDCLLCSTNYTMNATTKICATSATSNTTTDGSHWLSAMALLAFLIML